MTNTDRMVIDYRRLNNQTVEDKFPLPCIDDILDHLSGNKMFSVLDMTNGYFQIPLEEGSRHKAALTTPDRHFQPIRMVFGLANDPPVYQRMITQALGPLIWTSASCYLDDIIITAKDWPEMLRKLEDVLCAIAKANLTLCLEKCGFAAERAEYLGFVLTAEGISPGKKKLAAIEEFKAPTNAIELKRFLGLISFFRRFIHSYAFIAAPLHRLQKGGTEFKWTEEANRAFDALKGKLLEEPVLRLYDHNA